MIEIQPTGKLLDYKDFTYDLLDLCDLICFYEGVEYKESWLPVYGFEHFYQISNLGRVKAVCVKKLRGRYYHNQPEKILKQKVTTKGYLDVELSNLGSSKHFSIHRLVASHFIPNPENREQVNHLKGNKKDNRFFMLEWATPLENTTHAIKNGLSVVLRGEENGFSKLTKDQVLAIRKSTLSHKQAAKEFNVYFSTIQKIRYRQTWAHV